MAAVHALLLLYPAENLSEDTLRRLGRNPISALFLSLLLPRDIRKRCYVVTKKKHSAFECDILHRNALMPLQLFLSGRAGGGMSVVVRTVAVRGEGLPRRAEGAGRDA